MPRSRAPDDGPHPVDVHVGQRVKGRRLSLGMSQDDLAQACGITFQQVQKYERGTNRISVSRLTEIAQALKTSLEYFVDGLSTFLPGTAKTMTRGFAESKQTPFESEPESRDEIELLRSYRAIKSAKTKKQVREMAQALAQTGKDD